MSQVSMERKRTPRRAARRRIPIPAMAAAAGVAIAALSLAAGAKVGSAARGAPARLSAPLVVVARLADIPSHDGLYRASMVPAPDAIEGSRPLAWTVAVRTAAGAPVVGAALALESWMPDDTTVAAPRPWATTELDGGRYRVEGLRFDRSG